MKKIVDFLKKNMKLILSVVVVIALAVACINSVVQDRRKVTKDMGRMIALTPLYDEPELKRVYAKTSYESLNLTADETGFVNDGVGAYSDDKSLTEQQKKDKAALEALLESNDREKTTIADAARSRNSKYTLNSIKTIAGNGSVTITPNSGGVYANSASGTYLGQFVLTGYCPCAICCGKTNGVTASGRPARANHTIAADRRFAFGTQMIINNMVYTVDDRGGAIKGNRIDIFFNTHSEALKFGRRRGDVYLYTGQATTTASNGGGAATSASGITVIGDSLMVGATSSFKSLASSATIDAKSGRTVSSATDIASNMKKSGTLGSKVVIAIGTGGTFSESTGQKLIDAIGSDKKIYWVNTYGPKLSSYSDVNSVIQKLANKNSNVSVIDWKSKSSSNKSLFSNDGKHLTSSGYQTYAQTIYNAIK